jgi:hypothetical protein
MAPRSELPVEISRDPTVTKATPGYKAVPAGP